jgi:RNA polymerase sigma factor (TIGR02999 family)
MSEGLTATEITQLLAEWNQGDFSAFERLAPIVYDDLRRMAGRQLSGERLGHTLEATALVHEFYLRFIGHRNHDWQNRAHFFGAAAKLMRRVLVEYSRQRRALKRGGSAIRLEIPIDGIAEWQPDFDALDQALDRLAELDPRQSRIVELRYFLGLSNQATADELGISVATVKREWAIAKAWLFRRLAQAQ